METSLPVADDVMESFEANSMSSISLDMSRPFKLSVANLGPIDAESRDDDSVKCFVSTVVELRVNVSDGSADVSVVTSDDV